MLSQRRFLASALAVALAASLTACASSSGGLPVAAGPLVSDSTLALRPGDVIKIQVFGHDDLSGEFPIDENYNLLFPVMGELNVRGMSVQELRARVRSELGRLFTQPYVAVIPLFRVAVLGEVNRPGLYSVDPTLSVYDLMALAGGPLRTANTRDLSLVRGGQVYRLQMSASSIAQATIRELGVRSGDQLLVPRTSLTREDALLILQIFSVAISIVVLVRQH